MPSSSSSAGFSSRATISSWLNASVATGSSFRRKTTREHRGIWVEGASLRGSQTLRWTAAPAEPARPPLSAPPSRRPHPLGPVKGGSLDTTAQKGAHMAFEVPPLPYDYDALEPPIDEATMRVHHDKHHQAYVDNANAALEGTPLADKPVEHVLTNLETLPDDKQTAVRNNAGGHVNHSLFWEIMGPDGGGVPSGALADAIGEVWGGFDELKKLLNETGVKRFGSGWTWLVHDGTGLAVYSTPNQDSPILNDDFPILGIDVWEHAYYLKYQNRRPDYLEAWWNVVNWDAVSQRFDRAVAEVGAPAT